MKRIMPTLCLCLLLLAGCAHQMNMDVENMPCHQMPDGQWMGDCSEKPHAEDSEKESTFLPQTDSDTKKAKSSSIVSLDDGDTFELSADIISKEINGKEFTMYGYNGQIPGPVIRVRKNSTITVEFQNNIDWNTTIHWHGLRHNISNDGVPGVSQHPVVPGGSHTYEVYFPDEGIYWYHPHIREDIQQDAGLAGNLLVDSENYYNPVNREEVLILDDLLIENDQLVPYGEHHANYVVMGRFGNVILVNGQPDYTLQVQKGDVVRFYITNVANVRPFNLSFPGAQIKLVGGDLGKYEQEEFVDSVTIAPAERYIIEVYFEKSRVYHLMHIHPSKQYQLGRIIADNTETDQDNSIEFSNLKINEEVVENIELFEQYFNKQIDYEINLTIDMPIELMENMDMHDMPCHQMPDGTMMGRCEEGEEQHQDIEWEDDMGLMNVRSTSEEVTWILKDVKTGNENMDIRMKAKVGDKIKIRLVNDENSMHPMQHPIHLHGQRFLVLAIDGKPVENKVWKDTVLVPTGDVVDILVDVTNPGRWMMHCHIAEHLEAGMMASFIVEP